MIKAIIFDLDGTLVQTEALKAASYARAAVELKPDTFSEEEVIEAFKDVVGPLQKKSCAWFDGTFWSGRIGRGQDGRHSKCPRLGKPLFR